MYTYTKETLFDGLQFQDLKNKEYIYTLYLQQAGDYDAYIVDQNGCRHGRNVKTILIWVNDSEKFLVLNPKYDNGIEYLFP